jgi:hypothetical protein
MNDPAFHLEEYGIPSEALELTEAISIDRAPYFATHTLHAKDGAYGTIGQIINVPVDVDIMVRCSPRSLDDDYAFNVNLKKKIKVFLPKRFREKIDSDGVVAFPCHAAPLQALCHFE